MYLKIVLSELGILVEKLKRQRENTAGNSLYDTHNDKLLQQIAKVETTMNLYYELFLVSSSQPANRASGIKHFHEFPLTLPYNPEKNPGSKDKLNEPLALFPSLV